MTDKTKNIIAWVLAGLVAFVFLGSASGKVSGNAEALKMAATFGIDAKEYFNLGLIEIISVILFLIPRTGMIGTLLLSAYMGGAIATHVGHDLPVLAPCLVLTFVLMVAAVRFPEMKKRLLNQSN
jgi:hypothetical protein